jgi:hypothetical protein
MTARTGHDARDCIWRQTLWICVLLCTEVQNASCNTMTKCKATPAQLINAHPSATAQIPDCSHSAHTVHCILD